MINRLILLITLSIPFYSLTAMPVTKKIKWQIIHIEGEIKAENRILKIGDEIKSNATLELSEAWVILFNSKFQSIMELSGNGLVNLQNQKYEEIYYLPSEMVSAMSSNISPFAGKARLLEFKPNTLLIEPVSKNIHLFSNDTLSLSWLNIEKENDPTCHVSIMNTHSDILFNKTINENFIKIPTRIFDSSINQFVLEISCSEEENVLLRVIDSNMDSWMALSEELKLILLALVLEHYEYYDEAHDFFKKAKDLSFHKTVKDLYDNFLTRNNLEY